MVCNGQILDAVRADYQSWQSQSSNTDSTQSEVTTCLPAKYHELVSEFLECNKDYIHLQFTVKLQLSTVYTEFERERSVTGKTQSGL